MTAAIKRRRGTTLSHSTFVGLEGELTVDTDKKAVVVHDGVTSGGFSMAGEKTENTFTAKQSFTGTTAAAPAIAGAGDPNTGVFFPAADTVAVSTGGAERMRIDASGNVVVASTNKLQFFNSAYYIRAFSGLEINATDYTRFLLADVEKARLNAAGEFVVTAPTGLGYGPGAGGSAIQDTSKSQPVWLNKPTGQITTSDESMVAGEVKAFTFYNSLLTSTVDSLYIHRVSGGSALSYQIIVDSIGVGAAYISIKNISATTLAEGLNLKFTVLKGAIA